jgi:hypothetical protein
MASVRIDSESFAQANIGAICEYNTSEGIEYGLILRVTPSELVLQRLMRTEDGSFAPHPEPICPRSKNRVTYMKRKVMLVCLKEEESYDPVCEASGVNHQGILVLVDPVCIAPSSDVTK